MTTKPNRAALIALSIFICFASLAKEPFGLETGDLLFQVNGSGEMVDAITDVTSGFDGVNFSHVGVVSVERKDIFVLEAVSAGVSKTPIDQFLENSKKTDGKPVVAVGRLKPRFRKDIPKAVNKINTLIGKPYDFLFAPGDDNYYCSELVYETYRRAGGKHIFKPVAMTFKEKDSGKTSPLWIKHFEERNAPIPEGVEGTNPGDMSRSKAIKIVHRYF